MRQRDQWPRASTVRILLGLVVVALAPLVPSDAASWHVDAEQLREEGLELEIEDLEIELDDETLEVDYRVDSSDWQEAVRSGVSLWLGIFVERGAESSGNWDLWYALPMLSDDGRGHFPGYLELREREHVAVRFIGISNGSYLSPGHGVFTNGSLYVAVRGNHSDDHSHADADDPQIKRHVRLEHRSSVLYTVEMKLSYTGSLHRFSWFTPAYGFHRLRYWLQRQHLLTSRFRRHLKHHHENRRVITHPRPGHRHHGVHHRHH